MNLFFRAGDSRRAKQVMVAVLVIAAFAIYGGLNRHNFLPSDLVSEAAPIAAAIVSLAFAVALWRDDNPNAPYNNYGPIRRAFSIGLGAVVAFGLSWMATFGLSSAIVRAGAPESSVEATIEAVYPEGRGKGCHYRVQLHASNLTAPVNPCIPEELWRRARPGAHVTVVAVSGALGTQLIDVRVVE